MKLRRFALAIGCGLLWGAAVTAMEALSQPTSVLPLSSLIGIVSAIGWTWLVNGIYWALVALPVSHAPVSRQLLLVGPLALAITLVHLVTWWMGITVDLNGGGTRLLGNSLPWDALFAHMVWMNLFYGGLYMLAFSGARRARASRQLLVELASSGAATDAHRQKARLRALRSQLQPGILVHALDKLSHDYAAASPRADPLFDDLVCFLRAAMPTVREGQATLASELALVEAYAELRHQLGSGDSAVIAVDEDFDASAIAFPSLCLLPLIEALSPASPTGHAIAVRSAVVPKFAELQIDISTGADGPPSDPTDDAVRRLRHELVALHGIEATLALSHAAGLHRLSIRLPLSADSAAVPPKETQWCVELCR